MLGFDNENHYQEFSRWGRDFFYQNTSAATPIAYDDSEFEKLAKLCQGAPDLFNKAVRSALRRAGRYMRKKLRMGIKSASYFDNRAINYALKALQFHGASVSLTVYGAQAAGHKFRLVPNRITARKGKRSIYWPSPGVKIGPDEKVRRASDPAFYKPFIANMNGLKAMYWREKDGGRPKMPTFASPQYFAAFDRVQKPVLDTTGEIFLQRLAHEVYYRLGLGK